MIDARRVPPGSILETDLCIVGAGPAGLSIACELAHHAVDFILVERGGGNDPADDGTEWHSEDESVGLPYDLPASRRIGLGGTSHAWDAAVPGAPDAAQMLPLDDYDFEPRSWVPHSGWPVGFDELGVFYDRAYAAAGLNPRGRGADHDLEARAGWPGPGRRARLAPSISNYSIGQGFRSDVLARLKAAPNARILIHATVTGLETVGGGQEVSRVEIAAAPSQEGFAIRARYVVLAAGGVENARLLLASTKEDPRGVGNEHDLVGRFFMEHPKGDAGVLMVPPELVPVLEEYSPWMEGGFPVRRHVKIQRHTLEAEALLGCRFALWPVEPDWLHDGLRKIAERQLEVGGSHRLFALSFMLEQAPNPESRVRLSKTDAGAPAVTLDWRVTEQEYRSLIRCVQIVQEECYFSGLGTLLSRPHTDATGGYEVQRWQGYDSPIVGSHHHIGTTRMSVEPSDGVVDPTCRVHGVDNLFVAGSSVFPTSSHANPTLTIVALSLRLADHLLARLRGNA